MKQQSMYAKKVKQEDIEAGEKLLAGFKKWIGPNGDGYGIKEKE